jgi:hypothetical protein
MFRWLGDVIKKVLINIITLFIIGVGIYLVYTKIF